MSTTTKISKNASRKDVEQKLYRSMVRSLLYLIVSCPDISFSVGAYARYLKDEIFLSQSKCAKELVKKFGVEYSKHSRTPMSTTTKLSNYESRKNVEQKPYRSMIRSLLYLTMCRLDISFSIGAYARYSNVDWAENVENRKTHLPKLSILLLGAIVRNSYGSNKCSNTMELRKGHEHAL
ncbi:hypothetical protein CK203_054338 [Vitis vinifera]|uniref:Mitochondrial protein n=1 Tax=Vitis vinifera TaxID=29760 RepID=A0A438H086_VITVI|nr:hypothetical protein CK203_054338 [Vitis vinifera]